MEKDGSIEQIHEMLVETIRVQAGRKEEPTICIIDSQSVKTTDVSCADTGFDAGKKIKGRKRHLAVDALGLLLCVVVHSAGIQDRDGAIKVAERLQDRWKCIIKIFADGGYAGELIKKMKEQFGYVLEIVKREQPKEFKIAI